jgi:hypothetical protein
MDNAHVHSKGELEDLDKSDSTGFVSTPKCCPDLNLCEFWFAKVNAVFHSCHSAMNGLKLDEWQHFLADRLLVDTTIA